MIVISALVLFSVTKVFSDRQVTIQTRLGAITGTQAEVTFDNVIQNYTVFKKIPFAQPPIGHLRLEKPVPSGKWSGTLDATTFGPSCIQTNNSLLFPFLPNLDQSEDCLFLNIYVPTMTRMSKKLSVMIWVHGGGYTVGQGMLYDGSYLSVTGNVIVVTINYRLGVFGFVSTMDSIEPGNYGLWDQRLAFQWVHDNIDSFGGDPNSVTIFGESAGGFSVALHALNPDNIGLFHRVIAQSGTSNSIYTLSYDARSSAKSLARALNCSDTLSSDTIRCIKAKTAKELFQGFEVASQQVGDSLDIHMHSVVGFGPVIDGMLLKNQPDNLLINHISPEFQFYKSLDVIIGNCESEGSLIIDYLEPMKDRLPFKLSEGISSDFLCSHIFVPLIKDHFHNNIASIPMLCQKYSTQGSIQQQGQMAANFLGDLFFYVPAVQSLNAHANGNDNTKQYQYMTRRRSVFSKSEDSYPWFTQAGHGSELPFVFPLTSDLSKEDTETSKNILKYWSNFAKTGNVNGPDITYWPQYDVMSKHYAILDVNVTIQNNLYSDRIDFWMTQFILNQP